MSFLPDHQRNSNSSLSSEEENLIAGSPWGKISYFTLSIPCFRLIVVGSWYDDIVLDFIRVHDIKASGYGYSNNKQFMYFAMTEEQLTLFKLTHM